MRRPGMRELLFGLMGLWFLLPVLLKPFLGMGIAWQTSPYLMSQSFRFGINSLLELLVMLGMPALLWYYAYRTYQSPAGKQSTYLPLVQGNETLFTVTPAQAPLNWFAVILTVILYGSWQSTHWIIGAIMIGLMALILLSNPRGAKANVVSRFSASPAGITLDDQLFKKTDIHQLQIRNNLDGDVVITYDANQGIPTGTVMGLAHRRRLAEVGYRVDLECAGKVHTLAGGMHEATARGLVADVLKRMEA